MGTIQRRLAALFVAVLMAFGLSVVPTGGAANASYSCGWHSHRGAVQWVPNGYSTYSITNIHIHWKNCYSKRSKRPDISWAPDLSCKTLSRYQYTSWIYRDNSRDMSRYRGLVSC